MKKILKRYFLYLFPAFLFVLFFYFLIVLVIEKEFDIFAWKSIKPMDLFFISEIFFVTFTAFFIIDNT